MSNVPAPEKPGGWELKSVTKNATFKELSRTEREQHELHFDIIEYFTSANSKENKKGDKQVRIKLKEAYPLILNAFDTLLVINEDFKPQDKEEFLNDSAAILDFGMWLIKEKITPFFSQLMQS